MIDRISNGYSDGNAMRSLIAYICGAVVSVIPIMVVRNILIKYILSVIVFCAVFVAVYYALKHFEGFYKKIWELVGTLLPAVLLLLTGIIFYYLDIYDGSGILTGSYYVSRLISGKLTVIFIAIGIGLWWLYRKFFCKWFDCGIIAVGEMLAAITSKVWYTKYIAAYDLHYDAYFYPIYRIASGDTCYVDFSNIYGGGYAYLLAPFVHSTGEQAVIEFSIEMCILVFAVFSMIFYILFKVCNNKIMALIGFIAVIYYPSVFMIEQQGYSYYLQYVPHRMLFPCIFMVLMVQWFEGKKQITKILIRVVNVLAVFWNLETGIICVLATMLLFTLGEVVGSYQRLGKATAQYVFEAFFEVLASIGLLQLVTYIRSGELVAIEKMMYAPQYFIDYGGTDNKTVCWFITVVFIDVTLAYVLTAFVDRVNGYKRKMVLLYALLAVMLGGILTYALLKPTHPYNVTVVMYIVIMIFVLWINQSETEIGHGNPKELNVIAAGKTVVGIAVLAVLAGTLLCRLPETDEKCYANVDVYLPETLGFIQGHIVKNIDVDLLMLNSGYMYCMMGIPDRGHGEAAVDWLVVYDDESAETILEHLQKAERTVVLDNYAINSIKYFDEGGYTQKFDRIMSERYRDPIVSENGNLRIYVPISED